MKALGHRIAATVTRGAVRCSAWLGVCLLTLCTKADDGLPRRTLGSRNIDAQHDSALVCVGDNHGLLTRVRGNDDLKQVVSVAADSECLELAERCRSNYRNLLVLLFCVLDPNELGVEPVDELMRRAADRLGLVAWNVR